MNKSQPRVRASWLGSVPYREAWDLQAALVRELREGAGHDTLLLLEHPHVFTMGKAAAPEHVLWDEDERVRRRGEVGWSDPGGGAPHPRQGELGGPPVGRPTSVEAATGRRIDARSAAEAYTGHFEAVFGVGVDWVPAGRLREAQGTPVRT